MSKNQQTQGLDGEEAPDCAPDGTEGVAASHGWERPSVTFRLTRERRRALLEIAPELGLRASPTAAIDFAIERATGIGVASMRMDAKCPSGWGDEAAEELQAVLAACAALRDNGAQTRAAVERLESRLATHESANEVKKSPISLNLLANEVEACHASDTLGAWLDREAGSKVSWTVVKARWIEARPTDSGKAKVRVQAWVAAPHEMANQAAPSQTVEAGPMQMSAMEAFGQDSVGIFVCSRSEAGWTVRIHALDKEGKLGKALDSFVA